MTRRRTTSHPSTSTLSSRLSHFNARKLRVNCSTMLQPRKKMFRLPTQPCRSSRSRRCNSVFSSFKRSINNWFNLRRRRQLVTNFWITTSLCNILQDKVEAWRKASRVRQWITYAPVSSSLHPSSGPIPVIGLIPSWHLLRVAKSHNWMTWKSPSPSQKTLKLPRTKSIEPISSLKDKKIRQQHEAAQSIPANNCAINTRGTTTWKLLRLPRRSSRVSTIRNQRMASYKWRGAAVVSQFRSIISMY